MCAAASSSTEGEKRALHWHLDEALWSVSKPGRCSAPLCLALGILIKLPLTLSPIAAAVASALTAEDSCRARGKARPKVASFDGRQQIKATAAAATVRQTSMQVMAMTVSASVCICID